MCTKSRVRYYQTVATDLLSKSGDVVQLVRTLPCHGRGRGFESRRPRQFPTVQMEKLQRIGETQEYRTRVNELENEGLTTSDAQAVADAEILKGEARWIPTRFDGSTGRKGTHGDQNV